MLTSSPSFCIYGLFCKPSTPLPPPPACSARWKTKASIRIHEHAFSQKRCARRLSRKWNAAFWSFLSGRFRSVRFRHPHSAVATLQCVSSEAGQGFLGAESMLLTGGLPNRRCKNVDLLCVLTVNCGLAFDSTHTCNCGVFRAQMFHSPCTSGLRGKSNVWRVDG